MTRNMLNIVCIITIVLIFSFLHICHGETQIQKVQKDIKYDSSIEVDTSPVYFMKEGLSKFKVRVMHMYDKWQFSPMMDITEDGIFYNLPLSVNKNNKKFQFIEASIVTNLGDDVFIIEDYEGRQTYGKFENNALSKPDLRYNKVYNMFVATEFIETQGRNKFMCVTVISIYDNEEFFNLQRWIVHNEPSLVLIE